jgi:hypothetical protein
MRILQGTFFPRPESKVIEGVTRPQEVLANLQVVAKGGLKDLSREG